jgi:Polyketide cyclase / dehydrase and lipid transport
MTLDRPALRVSMAVRGPRPADDVWDRYVRPQRWPQWAPQIRSVVYPAEMLSTQTGGVVRGPGGLPVRFRILDVVATGPVRSWSWSVWAAGVQLHLRHTVEATTTGTRTGLTVQGFAPAVLLYLPMARWALHRLVH